MDEVTPRLKVMLLIFVLVVVGALGYLVMQSPDVDGTQAGANFFNGFSADAFEETSSVGDLVLPAN